MTKVREWLQKHWIVVTAACSIVGLLGISGYWWATGGQFHGDGRTKVRDGAAASASSEGVTVTLPAGSARGNGKLTVSRASLPDSATEPQLSDIVRAVGDRAVRVELAGATLSGPARITFPVTQLGPNLSPVVVWQDGSGGWEFLPTDWEPGRPTATAQLSHFSIGFLAGVDVKDLASKGAKDFLQYISGRSGAAQPTCGDEATLRASGVQVVSDGGDTVKWCHGIENGKEILRITNNRRTFSEVNVPRAWTPVETSLPEISTDALVRGLGDAIDELVVDDDDRRLLVLDGGDTVTLQIVPTAGTTEVVVEMAVTSWLLSAVVFGLETFSHVRNAFRPELRVDEADTRERLVNGLVNIGADHLDGKTAAWRAAAVSCWKAVLDETGGSLDPPGADTVRGILKAGWQCVPSLLKADLDLSGVTGGVVGVVWDAITAVVATVLSAVNLLVSGARELYDSVASVGGKSDVLYSIRLTRPESDVGTSGPGTDQSWGEPVLEPGTEVVAAGPDEALLLGNSDGEYAIFWIRDTTSGARHYYVYDVLGNAVTDWEDEGGDEESCGARVVRAGPGTSLAIVSTQLHQPAEGIRPETWSTRFEARDALTGAARWTFTLKGFGICLDDSDDHTVSGTSASARVMISGRLIDAVTGRVVADLSSDGFIGSHPFGGSPEPQEAGAESYHLYSPETGRRVSVWKVDPGHVAAKVGSRWAAVVGEDEFVSARSVPSGRTLWRHREPEGRWAQVLGEERGVIIAEAHRVGIFGLDARSGRRLWRLTGGRYCYTAIGRLWVEANGQTAQIDVRTGEQVSYNPDRDRCGQAAGPFMVDVDADGNTILIYAP